MRTLNLPCYNTIERIRQRSPAMAEYLENNGFRSINQMCKHTGLHPNTVGRLLKGDSGAFAYINGEYTPTVRKLSEESGFIPEELFPECSRHTDVFPKCKYEDPVEHALRKETETVLRLVMRSLSAREQLILKYRFGFDNRPILTLEDIGRRLDITRETVRGIEARALRKLRHDYRFVILKDVVDESRAELFSTPTEYADIRYAFRDLKDDIESWPCYSE